MAFFQGTLQEGIAVALQQAKSVLCFVTDGEAESQLWENEYFAEDEIPSLLQSQAVSLRLVAGSQEEGFLSQLYPLPKKPTLVIIRNGELREYIAAGVSKEDFMTRLQKALMPAEPALSQPGPAQAAPNQAVAQSALAQPAPQQPAIIATLVPPTNQPSHGEESSASSSGQATPASSMNSRVQSFLAQRAVKLAEQKKNEEEAKRQRAEKARAKAEAGASGLKQPDAQSKHAEALKKKRREAREERERILKAIEDDKSARKAEKAAAEAARKAAAESEKPDSPPLALASHLPPSSRRLSEHCSLQVRLFDGSTIRSRFLSTETIKDVRQWVDKNRSNDKNAYTFKVLLTPLPSKTIDGTEEDKTLQEMELVPSSTLILVRPPKRPATAYRPLTADVAGAVDGDQGSVFQRFLAAVLAFITGIFSNVLRFFSTLFSSSGPPAESEHAAGQPSEGQSTSQSASAAADAARRRRGGNIAGVDHTDARRNDQQFYNGNSTNFEPRPDDEK